jgi:peptidoglycan hydrolase-like protein with peptidoglycan-binding domain
MSWTIPPETKYSFKKNSRGIVVWAIQAALNDVSQLSDITQDGWYGNRTEARVASYQQAKGLVSDGIFGPASSQKMAQSLEVTVDVSLPDRLIEGFVDGESAGHIGAVNWSVAGGVDCSYLQRRVLDGSDDATIQRAFDGRYQFELLARALRDRVALYLPRIGVQGSTPLGFIPTKQERAWRLAALAHNWPYAADRMSRGYALSDRTAPWVPAGVTFKDGMPVVTYMDWAQFYALGAPEHAADPGLVTKHVQDWTP